MIVFATAQTSLYVASNGFDNPTCSNATAPCQTIAYAVSQANAGDTIKIYNGTYQLSDTIMISKSLSFVTFSNLSDVVLIAPSSGSMFTINNKTANVSFASIELNGNQSGSTCVNIKSSSTVKLSGLLIHDCGDSSSSGGAMNVYGTSIVAVLNCTFLNNAASNGGAIYNFNNKGTLNLSNCRFINNTADYGGGINNDNNKDQTLMSGCIFINNTASDGGGIYNNKGTMNMSVCTFINNNASCYGGGIYNDKNNDQTLMSGCKFINNTASYGGGIYNKGTMNTTNCTFTNNTASNGGGIYSSGTSILTNCSISQNWASGHGGGAYFAVDTTWYNTTFNCNQAVLNGTDDYLQCSSLNFTCMNCTFGCMIPTSTTTFTSTSTSTTASTLTSASTSTSTSTPPTTITSTSTTSNSTLMTVSNCTVSCPAIVVSVSQPINSTTTAASNVSVTWTVVQNMTTVQLNVSTSDQATQTYQVGWGSIREVTADGQVVKSLDPIAQNWPRSIEANDTTVLISYSTRLNQSVFIKLTTILTVQANNSNSVGAAKFSLSIDGDWQFTKTSNKLEADFTVSGAFREIKLCGSSTKYELQSTSDTDVYHFGSSVASSSSVALTVLRGCVADGVSRDTSTSEPLFFKNDTAVTITIRFPWFNSSLYYDPNFALLLGYFGSQSGCNQLLTWILPASFLAGAAVIILAVWLASFLDPVRSVFLGKEGMRIHKLRVFVSDKKLTLDSDIAL